MKIEKEEKERLEQRNKYMKQLAALLGQEETQRPKKDIVRTSETNFITKHLVLLSKKLDDSLGYVFGRI